MCVFYVFECLLVCVQLFIDMLLLHLIVSVLPVIAQGDVVYRHIHVSSDMSLNNQL